MLTRGCSPRLGRALVAALALVANLIAVGVPVLHAWAHEIHASTHEHEHEHEPDHGASVAGAGEGHHPHHEVHPLALHDECLLIHRAGLHLSLALPTAQIGFESFMADDRPALHPVPPVASRAPPSSDHARAPPLV